MPGLVWQHLQDERAAGSAARPSAFRACKAMCCQRDWPHPEATSAGQVASHRRPVVSPGQQCKRRSPSRAMPYAVHISPGGSSYHSRPGSRDTAGEDRFASGVQNGACPRGRPQTAGNPLARGHIYRHSLTIWAEVSTKNIFGILSDWGVAWQLHYLDDFLLMGPPGSQSCARSLQTTIDSCKQLGEPVAMHKTEGPGTTLTFLGVQINTQDMTL